MRAARVRAGVETRLDVVLPLSEVVEEIVVTSNVETISQTRQVATTYDQDEIEKLAISRDITSSINLTPGVHDTGPSSAPTINGAMVSYSNKGSDEGPSPELVRQATVAISFPL